MTLPVASLYNFQCSDDYSDYELARTWEKAVLVWPRYLPGENDKNYERPLPGYRPRIWNRDLPEYKDAPTVRLHCSSLFQRSVI
jgi:hypothetical protein